MDIEQKSPKDKYKYSKILQGFFVGIVFTLVLLFILNIVFNSNKSATKPTEKILKLELNSPNENLATSGKKVIFSGNTGIQSIVTISSGKQSRIVETTKANNFSTSLDLTEGKNVVTITAFNPKNGESQVTTRDILIIEEDLTNL